MWQSKLDWSCVPPICTFLEVSGDIVERVDPIFFSDPMTAAMKALGMT
jgi:hypothetical protein